MEFIKTEFHKITKEHPLYEFLIDCCIKSNNLYNHGNYVIRQEFIRTTKLKEQGKLEKARWIRFFDLCDILRDDKDYDDYHSLPVTGCSDALLQVLDKNWKSFFESIKDWKRNPNKFTGRPKLPKYKKKEQPYNFYIPNKKTFHIKGSKLIFTKAFKNLKLHIKCNKEKGFQKINQVKIKPIQDYLRIEIAYTIEIEDRLNKNIRNVISIDLGIDNLATITNNINQKPVIINGKPLKSINHYFNKQRAYLKERAEHCQKKKSTKRLQRLCEKRQNKITDYLHKTSKFIIDYCKQNKIGTIIIGHSKQWKSKVNIGKRNNQTFVNIPFNTLIQMIQYKAFQNNIETIIQEESYTSKASYFDNDKVPMYGHKGQKSFSGKRVKRGLYKCKDGSFVNADVNGSLNIMRKAVNDAEKPVDKGFVTSPLKITLNNTKFCNIKEFKK